MRERNCVRKGKRERVKERKKEREMEIGSMRNIVKIKCEKIRGKIERQRK